MGSIYSRFCTHFTLEPILFLTGNRNRTVEYLITNRAQWAVPWIDFTDEGALPEILQYGPSSRFECFTSSNGSNNYFYSSSWYIQPRDESNKIFYHLLFHVNIKI